MFKDKNRRRRRRRRLCETSVVIVPLLLSLSLDLCCVLLNSLRGSCDSLKEALQSRLCRTARCCSSASFEQCVNCKTMSEEKKRTNFIYFLPSFFFGVDSSRFRRNQDSSGNLFLDFRFRRKKLLQDFDAMTVLIEMEMATTLDKV